MKYIYKFKVFARPKSKEFDEYFNQLKKDVNQLTMKELDLHYHGEIATLTATIQDKKLTKEEIVKFKQESKKVLEEHLSDIVIKEPVITEEI